MTSSKQGISASELTRLAGFGSYQTAWTMLHRYRSVMRGPSRTRLSGTVEVDETLVGGTDEPGKGGRSHGSKKALVAVAAEQRQPKGFGRCRLEIIPDASAPTLRGFLETNLESGSTVVTDGWKPYRFAVEGYAHDERPVSGSGHQAHELLPRVHRAASLLKRWIEGTHQGSFSDAHLQAYLDEFCFRYNRRRSVSRGLLFYRLLSAAVASGPVTYRSLVADPAKKKFAPTPPAVHVVAGASVVARTAGRPWRNAGRPMVA